MALFTIRMIETIVSAVGDKYLKDWRERFRLLCSLDINTDFKSY